MTASRHVRPRRGRHRGDTPAATVDLDGQIAAVRRFNRFYTRTIGVLDEGHLQSPFSLTEVRVLYELAHRRDPTAAELARDLGLDGGYVSRMLQRFERRRLMRRTRATSDARQQHLHLTATGHRTFATLNEHASADVRHVLAALSTGDRQRLLQALATVETLLGARTEPRVPYLLRPPHPGDLGWVVQRNAEIYAREYGWNEEYEALVAEIVAQFARSFDAKRERCWIAEREGENVGCVFLVRESQAVARLRLLLVDPPGRGLGIGRRLVAECTTFARAAGYEQIVLWTNGVLATARHLYEQEGYRLVSEEPHHSFGHDLVGQTWRLDLRAPAAANDI